ncbi:MAG TPA: hypothetical protein VKU84_10545 [Stellaceae bacterium]|nr:hypothetical protein [Stellaceae bacterium]
MSQLRSHLLIFAAAALLSGCSFVDSVLTGDDNSQDDQYPPADSEQVQIPPSPAEQNPQPTQSVPVAQTPTPPPTPAPIAQAPVAQAPIAQAPVAQAPASAPPAVGTGNYAPQPVTPGTNTGTYVGQKVASLRGDLQRLQGNINQHNQELQQARQGMGSDAGSYYSLVASINSRLQIGTTPGNPQLVSQWTQAQSALGRLNDDITRLNTISNSAASDSALAAYILESVRAAYGLQGAVDEDHRQLAILENDCNRTVVLIDRLLNDLSEDISRQSNYVSNERRNLTVLSLAIKNGELYGGSLNNRAFASAAAPPQQIASATPAIAGRQPLMVIRFDRPNVAYEQALYSAVSRALDRRPGATFDVVAVSPAGGNPGMAALNTNTSKRNAETVVRSLTNMGLPPDRINLSATSSASAQGNEVQVFVR